MESSEAICLECNNRATSACVQDVNRTVVLGHGDWKGAIGRFLVDPNGDAIENVKA